MLIALAVVLHLPSLSLAQSTTWTNGLGGNWSDGGNWVPGTPPGPGTNALFTTTTSVVYPTYVATNDVLNNTFGNLTIYNLSGYGATLYSATDGFNPAGDVSVGYAGYLTITNSTATIGGSMTISNSGRFLVFDGANVTVNGSLDNSYGVWIQGTNTVLSVLGGGVNRASSGYPFLPIAPTDLQFFNNGTLNIGGTDAASANASSVTLTNAGSLTFNGYGNGYTNSTSGAINGTINASTNQVGVYNTGTIQNFVGSGGGYINGTFVNETNGAVLPGPYGAQFVFERFTTNRGTVYVWNYYSAITINKGDYVNQGFTYMESNPFSVLGGAFINDTNGVFQTGFYGGTLNAQSLLNRGTLNITSTYVGPVNFACVMTNQGLVTLYRSDLIDFGRSVYAAIQASNIVNSGTIMALGQTNVFTHTSHPTFLNEIYNAVTNLPGGVITTTNGALLGFYPGVLPKNYGTIIVNPNSAVGMGSYDAAGYGDDKVLYLGLSDYQNDGTIDLRGGTLAAASVSNAPGASLMGWGDVGLIAFSNIVSTSGLTTNYARQFSVRPIHNSGTVLVNGTLNAGTVNNYSGGVITGSGAITSSNSTDYFVGETLSTSNNNTGAGVVNFTGGLVLADGTTLTLGNGLANQGGTATVTNGGVLNLGTSTNTNSGLFNLRGGTISSGGLLNNSNIVFAGTPSTLSLSGPLTIASSGNLQVLNTTGTVTSSVISSGKIDPQNGRLIIGGNASLLAGSQTIFTNNGTVEVSGAVTNASTLAFTSGAALLAGSLSSSGPINFDNGGTVQITGPASTTSGINFTNSGVFSAASLNSSGSIQFQNGGSLLASVVTNSGTIEATNGTAVIGGAIVNSGRIRVFDGANVTVNGSLNNSYGVWIQGTNTVLSVLGGGINTAASGYPYLPFAPTDLMFFNNGTLNIGGTNAASANASSVTFTNAGSLTFNGYYNGYTNSTSGAINGTINASTNQVGFYNTGTIQNFSGSGGGYINATFVNETNGAVLPGPYGAQFVFERFPTNRGTVYMWNYYTATTVNKGDFVNQGYVHLEANPLSILGGAFINDTNGLLDTSLYASTINAQSAVNRGTIAITSDYVQALKFNCVLTNEAPGKISLYRGNYVGFGRSIYGAIEANNIINYGTIKALGESNVFTYRSGSTFMNMIYNGVTNMPGGVITTTNGAILGFYPTVLPKNYGRLIVNADSTIGMGAYASSYYDDKILYAGLSDYQNDGTIDLRGGTFGANSVSNGASGILQGSGDIGYATYSNLISASLLTTNYVKQFTAKPIANTGIIAPSGLFNAGTITNLSGGRIIGNGTINSYNVVNYYSGETLLASNAYTGARIFNNAGATILASGGTLVLSNGLVNNSNAGTIGATNGVLQLGDGNLALTNNGAIYVYNGGLNIGALRNNGAIKITASTVTFSNPVVNAGSYVSDPSTNVFLNDLTITMSGTIAGGGGDLFEFRQNFLSSATNNATFNLAQSTVLFSGGSVHTNAVTGMDLGATNEAPFISGNFAYGELALDSTGDQVYFTNLVGAIGTTALYAREVDLLGDTNNVANLHSPFNIYYAFGEPGNAYLNNLSYGLDGGGFLIPAIPEPSALVFASLAFIWLACRRRSP